MTHIHEWLTELACHKNSILSKFFLQQATKSKLLYPSAGILYGVITIADCEPLFFGSLFLITNLALFMKFKISDENKLEPPKKLGI